MDHNDTTLTEPDGGDHAHFLRALAFLGIADGPIRSLRELVWTTWRQAAARA